VLQLQLHQVKLYCAVKLVRSWGSPARAIPMSRAPQKSCEPGTPDEPITGFAGDLPTVGSLWFACTRARSSGSSLWGVADDITTSGHTTTTTASITATAVGTTPLRCTLCGHRLLIVSACMVAQTQRAIVGTAGRPRDGRFPRGRARLCSTLQMSLRLCLLVHHVRPLLTDTFERSSGHKISKVASELNQNNTIKHGL
jgi:hypothetical protein